MNKKCVYTAVTGGYDKLMQPKVIDKTYDFICFSNDIHEYTVGVWQIRPIPFYHKDNKRVAMFAKFHPHTLLLDYDYAIWIDANNRIKDNYIYDKADQFYSNGEIIGHITHPESDCIYQEVFRCMLYNKDKMMPLIKTLRFLLRNEYPHRQGLYENNLIFWSHHNRRVIEVLELFWEVYLKVSRRDQLTLNYIYYVLNVHPGLYFPIGEHMKNSEHIQQMSHNNDESCSKNVRINKFKIRIVRLLFLIFGYDLRYNKLYS